MFPQRPPSSRGSRLLIWTAKRHRQAAGGSHANVLTDASESAQKYSGVQTARAGPRHWYRFKKEDGTSYTHRRSPLAAPQEIAACRPGCQRSHKFTHRVSPATCLALTGNRTSGSRWHSYDCLAEKWYFK